MSDVTHNKTFAAAWREYLSALEDSATWMESDPACADRKVHDAALYLPAQLQAGAFYMHLAPHKGYPLINRRHISEPIGLNWGLPNPDFDYRFGYLDGRRRYRIHGPQTSGSVLFDIIVFSGYFEDGVKTYFHGPINQFQKEDGSIEFFLGPETDGPNQIVLDAAEPHIVFTIREAYEDWTREQVTPLRIECVSPVEERGPFLYPEADMAVRLERAAALVRNATKRTKASYTGILENTNGKENVFYIQGINDSRRNNNAHPDHVQCHGIYNVKAGESLIIETELPRSALYWGVQVGDLWWRSVDYTWNQSSLNRKNAFFGPDGVFRAVVSHEDPGIQNWLNPVDNERGRILMRLYRASDRPVPRTKVVPSAEVRKHLPADIPHFSPEQRKAQLAARTEAALLRYGY